MDYNFANWIVSLIALGLGISSIYFQFLRKGKPICRLDKHIEPAIDVDLDKEICKIGITVVFENNQRKDWIITSLSLEYRLFDSFGIHSNPWQLIREDKSIRIPAGQSLDKNFEIVLPLKNLEFWINPMPPTRSKAKSNSEFSYPFTQILPFWQPFYENQKSVDKLLKFIEKNCPKENKKMCLEMINYTIRKNFSFPK
jgi:hypothetical protein